MAADRWWCLTHDCWDGRCGVLGEHEVVSRKTRADAVAQAINDHPGAFVVWRSEGGTRRARRRPHVPWLARLCARIFGRSKTVYSGGHTG